LISCGQIDGWKTIYAPLLITYLIRFKTGVPILEESLMKNPEYRLYMDETSRFIPWKYKIIGGVRREDKLERYR